MAQYQRKLAELLGHNRLRGSLRLAWTASCSPPLTIQRVARVIRKRLLDRRGRAADSGPIESREMPAGGEETPVRWPPKYDLFGVRVSATQYDQAADLILAAARRRQPAVVSHHAVHALVTASGDPGLREAVNEFDILAPDGQPVRWALRLLHGVRLPDRVYGPELMLRLCRQ